MTFYLLSTITGVLLRWCVSLYPYSGAGKSPMFGDYEAQRHWQEITVNLPVKEWYVNTTNNDLLYWGLDYPPLTAYHSYLCGLLARLINPDYIALFDSRGYESYEHKLFMRYTVLLADLLVYFPAIYYFSKSIGGQKSNRICYFVLSLYPGLYLIDYGHFQYNNVSIGLFIAATAGLLNKRNLLGSFLFCLALNYKQMELYHALPFFFYLLGHCVNSKSYYNAIIKLISIGVVVIVTFTVIWLPFLSDVDLTIQVLKRIFPINRGLFEDKVANIWCSLSILVKFKSIISNSNMAIICLITTLIFLLPSCIHLFIFPTFRNFRYSLLNCSLVFFLFSFHVHEKSILLCTIPACMLIDHEPNMVTWFLIVANFSMYPLLTKEGLLLPAVGLTIFIYLMALFIHDVYIHKKVKPSNYSNMQNWVDVGHLLFKIFTGLMVTVTISTVVLTPPIHLPDIHSVSISCLACLQYCLFFLYFLCQQIFDLDLSKYRFSSIFTSL